MAYGNPIYDYIKRQGMVGGAQGYNGGNTYSTHLQPPTGVIRQTPEVGSDAGAMPKPAGQPVQADAPAPGMGTPQPAPSPFVATPGQAPQPVPQQPQPVGIGDNSSTFDPSRMPPPDWHGWNPTGHPPPNPDPSMAQGSGVTMQPGQGLTGTGYAGGPTTYPPQQGQDPTIVDPGTGQPTGRWVRDENGLVSWQGPGTPTQGGVDAMGGATDTGGGQRVDKPVVRPDLEDPNIRNTGGAPGSPGDMNQIYATQTYGGDNPLGDLAQLIRERLGSPGQYGSEEIMQLKQTLDQEEQRKRTQIGADLTANANARGVYYGSPLTNAYGNLESDLARQRSLGDSQLLQLAADSRQRGLDSAFRDALSFTSGASGEQAQLAQLAMAAMGLGLQGGADSGAAIAALMGIPGYGGTSGSALQAMGQMMGYSGG